MSHPKTIATRYIDILRRIVELEREWDDLDDKCVDTGTVDRQLAWERDKLVKMPDSTKVLDVLACYANDTPAGRAKIRFIRYTAFHPIELPQDDFEVFVNACEEQQVMADMCRTKFMSELVVIYENQEI